MEKQLEQKQKQHQKHRKVQDTEGEEDAPDCSGRDGRSKWPYMGKDSSERLLLREGVIDEIPASLCDSTQGKNVILVVGDGSKCLLRSLRKDLGSS